MDTILENSESSKNLDASVEVLYNNPQLLNIIVGFVPPVFSICLRRVSNAFKLVTPIPDQRVMMYELIAAFIRERNTKALCKLFHVDAVKQVQLTPKIMAMNDVTLIENEFVPLMISSNNIPVFEWLMDNGDIICQPRTKTVAQSGNFDMIERFIQNSRDTTPLIADLADVAPCKNFREIMRILIPQAKRSKNLLRYLVLKNRFDMARLLSKEKDVLFGNVDALINARSLPNNMSPKDLWWITKKLSPIKTFVSIILIGKEDVREAYVRESSDPYSKRFIGNFTLKVACLSKEKYDNLIEIITNELEEHSMPEHFKESLLKLVSDARI